MLKFLGNEMNRKTERKRVSYKGRDPPGVRPGTLEQDPSDMILDACVRLSWGCSKITMSESKTCELARDAGITGSVLTVNPTVEAYLQLDKRINSETGVADVGN